MKSPPTQPQNAPRRPWGCYFTALVMTLLIMFTLGIIGLEVFIGPLRLVIGWIPFVNRVLSQTRWDAGMIVGGVISFILAAAVLHLVARSFAKRLGRHWGWGSTRLVTGGFVLLFCSVLAMNGIIQITRWEMTDGVSIYRGSHANRLFGHRLLKELTKVNDNAVYSLEDGQRLIKNADPDSNWICVSPPQIEVLHLRLLKVAFCYQESRDGQYRIIFWDESVAEVSGDELEERLWFPIAAALELPTTTKR